MSEVYRFAALRCAAAALTLPCTTFSAFAQDTETQGARATDERSASSTENIVVTASRRPVAADEVGSSISVISAADLEVRRPVFVADALRDVPGLAVSRGGGFGAVTQVRMRGAEGNHTLVLIDGVEANNPVSNSEFDFAALPVGDIERIEVLRGPQSALYGSDAVGGVINVITRQPSPGLDAEARLEAGNLGTRSAALSLGGGGQRASGRLNASRLVTDGENLSRFGDEQDGFESTMLTLNGRLRPGELFDVDAKLHHVDTQHDFDSQDFAFPSTPTQGLLIDDDVSSRFKQWFARIGSSARLERSVHDVSVEGTRTRNVFFDAGAMTGRNEGEKIKLAYQGTIELDGSATSGVAGRRTLTLALEHERVDYSNRGATPDAAENQKRSDAQSSLVVEYITALDRATLSVSGRFDDNDLFADARTYRVNASYPFDERMRLRASFGTGVANPGFFDLFGFFPGSFIGNPALEPEHSTSFDIGIERTLGDRMRFDATYFRADLEDEIVTIFDSDTLLSTVENLDGESERRGVELALSAAPTERWTLSASYTYTDAREPDGAPELRRPRHVAALDNTVYLLDGRARLHIGIDHTGRQLDSELVFATPEDRVALEPFTLVDLAASFDVNERISLHAGVTNLLDEHYEEWFSYRGRGRAWSAGFALGLGR